MSRLERLRKFSPEAQQELPEESFSRNTFINRSVGIQNGMYGKWINDKKTGENSFIPLGNAVRIKKIIINAETMDRILELSFYDAQGKKVEFSIGRDKLTEQGISELTRKGVQVIKKDLPVLLATIFNQEQDAPCEVRHTELGFREYQGKKVFFGATGIDVQSSYNGSLSISQTGSFDKWKEMVCEEVIGTDMEIILAMASAAPIVDFFRKELHTSNLLISLVGESSTGKTTAGCLAVSCGASCSFSGDGMVETFANTKNAIMRSIYSSYPMLLDEGSLLRGNPTPMIYELAEGKEKARLTKDLTKTEGRSFATTIFTTSEKSLVHLGDENTGLLVRCLEFVNVDLTKSAVSADRIKTVCEQNYGFVIPMIAKKILRLNTDDSAKIVECYWEYQKALVEELRRKGKYVGQSERICKQVALIMLGGKVFSAVTGIDIDVISVAQKTLEYTEASDSEKLNIGQRALDYLCQYVAVNFASFAQDQSSDSEFKVSPINCKGRIAVFQTRIYHGGIPVVAELFIPEMVFEEILKSGGFQDKKIVLKKFREMGILHSDADRYVSKFIVVSEPKVKGYRIYIPADKEDVIFTGKKDKDGWEQVEGSPFPDKTRDDSEQEDAFRIDLQDTEKKIESILSKDDDEEIYAEQEKQRARQRKRRQEENDKLADGLLPPPRRRHRMRTEDTPFHSEQSEMEKNVERISRRKPFVPEEKSSESSGVSETENPSYYDFMNLEQKMDYDEADFDFGSEDEEELGGNE